MKSMQNFTKQFPLLFVIVYSSLITLIYLDHEMDILPHNIVLGHKVSVQFGTVEHKEAGS